MVRSQRASTFHYSYSFRFSL